MSDSGFPHFNLENNLGEVEDQSLDNLYATYVSREDATKDEVLRQVWTDHSAKKKHGGDQSLWTTNNPISEEEWLSRIRDYEISIVKDRIGHLLQLDINKLSDDHKESVGTLCAFLCTVHTLNDQNLLRLCRQFKKDVQKVRPARKGDERRSRPYSIEDWRSLFNELHFDD